MPKTALISGAGQGIGRCIAIRFAEAGYAVSLCDTDREAGLETIRMIKASGGAAMFMCADMGLKEDVERWVRVTMTELGQPVALINNAGISRNAPFLELTADDWTRVLSVNLTGAFLASQLVAREMKAQGTAGSIVNISSTRALMSEAGTEAYSASKGGILALTHAMAVSLGSYGIRVNAVSPGWIETRDWQYSSRASTPVHSEADKLQHPAGRVGVPDDIAQACLYLCGRNAGFITGQNLVIDGGMTVKMIYEE
jgi:NAD(P)-dependent dehydrogenase (short-subunit alcohol dehydrogenase family)